MSLIFHSILISLVSIYVPWWNCQSFQPTPNPISSLTKSLMNLFWCSMQQFLSKIFIQFYIKWKAFRSLNNNSIWSFSQTILFGCLSFGIEYDHSSSNSRKYPQLLSGNFLVPVFFYYPKMSQNFTWCFTKIDECCCQHYTVKDHASPIELISMVPHMLD